MNINFNQKKSSLLMIIVGIILLLFPLLSTATLGLITGLIVLIVALSLIFSGVLQFAHNRVGSIITILFGILCLYYSYRLIFIPATVSNLIGIILYLLGFIMIAYGIINIVIMPVPILRILGILTVIFGVIVIFLGGYLNNPEYLGYIIGLWFMISGLLSLFEDKGYIDV